MRASVNMFYLLFALVFCLSLSAQERFADISGTVKDATGAVIPNVKITIENTDTKRVYQTQTGSDGNYVALNIEPGKYDVRFERQGFSAQNAQGVNLLVGRTVRLDMTLQVGTEAQSVTVTETAGLIDLTATKVATNVTAEEFDRLPKGRSFQTLALSSTSVNGGHGDDIDGGLQVNGASAAENQYNIDGVSVTSLVNGSFRQGALYEILSEVQVKTSGLDAEYGGAMGGVISAITKSGGNAFHGDMHYYLSGNSLSAAPVQRLVLNPSTEKDVAYWQDSKFKNNQNEVGGTIGGPMIKDKLFFFIAFSPRFVHQQNQYLFSGKDLDSITRNQTYHTWFNKLSYQATPKLRTNFTYLWTPTRSLGRLPAYDGFCADCSTQTLAGAQPNKSIGFSQPQTSYTGQIDWTPTATSLITLRGGRFWDDYKSIGIPQTGAVEYATSATNLPFSIPDALRQPAGYSNTPRVTNTDHDLATRSYVQVDGSKIVEAWGQHNFKVGWGFSKTVNNVNDAYPGGGYVRIFWNSSEPLGVGGRGTYGYYEVNQRGTVGTTGGRMQNLYLQDTWQIKRRLTLSLGIRFENEHVPSFRRDIRDDAFAFGFGDKTAPRLGVSYDLFGNGKAKVYASYGRNYDWIKYELSRGSFGGDTWCIYYRSLDTTDIFSGLGILKPGQNLWSTNPANPCRDRRVPNFNTVAPGLKPFTADLYNGGVEYQLAGSVIRVGYVHNQVIRAIEDLGAIDANGNEVYYYGNPGEGATTITPPSGATKQVIPTPKPDRRYDGVEFAWTRRFSRGYFINASYTFSRLYGNYAGTQSTDEITLPTTGVASATAQQQGGNYYRQGGSANRAWDLDEILFDSHGHLDVEGRLPTDRPHVFKVYGSKEVRWNSINSTNFGVFFLAQSGTPVSTYVATTNQIPVFVEGRGDMGRTPVFSQTDLQVAHTFRIGETMRLGIEMNMLNLFNQKTATYYFNYLNRGAGAAEPGSAINLSKVDLYQGYDYRALINATADQKSGRGAFDPRYGKDALFNPGFQGRLGIRFTF
jgi:hypothetical protein